VKFTLNTRPYTSYNLQNELERLIETTASSIIRFTISPAGKTS